MPPDPPRKLGPLALVMCTPPMILLLPQHWLHLKVLCIMVFCALCFLLHYHKTDTGYIPLVSALKSPTLTQISLK